MFYSSTTIYVTHTHLTNNEHLSISKRSRLISFFLCFMFISMHITCTTNRARFSILFDFFLLHLALRFDFFFSNPNRSLMNKAEQIMNSVCVCAVLCVCSQFVIAEFKLCDGAVTAIALHFNRNANI